MAVVPDANATKTVGSVNDIEPARELPEPVGRGFDTGLRFAFTSRERET
jgi:hypothetical protein